MNDTAGPLPASNAARRMRRTVGVPYKLNVIGPQGAVAHIATTETAREALSVLRGTSQLHRRVWVSDQDGNDVSEADLAARAAQEA